MQFMSVEWTSPLHCDCKWNYDIACSHVETHFIDMLQQYTVDLHNIFMYIYVYVVSIIKINVRDETPGKAERILGTCNRNKFWWIRYTIHKNVLSLYE